MEGETTSARSVKCARTTRALGNMNAWIGDLLGEDFKTKTKAPRPLPGRSAIQLCKNQRRPPNRRSSIRNRLMKSR